MADIDTIVDLVMREMGCDPSAPPHWIKQEYHSATGYTVQDGFICSRCGKHSLVKRKTCDGCNSAMENTKEAESNERSD